MYRKDIVFILYNVFPILPTVSGKPVRRGGGYPEVFQVRRETARLPLIENRLISPTAFVMPMRGPA